MHILDLRSEQEEEQTIVDGHPFAVREMLFVIPPKYRLITVTELAAIGNIPYFDDRIVVLVIFI